MSTRALALVLILTTSAFAGCTGGDPDAGGTDELDMSMIMDFLNNSSIDLENNNYFNNTTVNNYHINGTAVSQTTTHTYVGVQAGGQSNLTFDSTVGYALLVREDAFPEAGAGSSMYSLDGAKICLEIGSSAEGEFVNWFGARGIAFTSVPIGGQSEGTSKFIDGSCDALAGRLSDLVEMQNGLDSNGSIQPGTWITTESTDGDFIQSDVFSEFVFSIIQEENTAIGLFSIIAVVSLQGTCINNCSQYEDIELVFSSTVFHYSGLHPTDSRLALYHSENINCEIGEFYVEGSLIPGLECEYSEIFRAVFKPYSSMREIYLENYQFEWSDWTYYVSYEETPHPLES
jgi:hypothetical protein